MAYKEISQGIDDRILRQEMVREASGGHVELIYDDVNNPSYMFRVNKFNVEDIDAGLGTGVHPAFIVGGVEIDSFYCGQYLASIKNGRAVSLPGVDPTASVNFDTAKGYCTAKGTGWHMLSNWEWAAIFLLCIKRGFQPTGNTDYGRHHTNKYETGIRQDGIAPGTASGAARTLTGSGPASWRHDNTLAGISDTVGNVAKWVDGVKIVDGKFYMPNDNDYTALEADWVDQGVIIADDAGTTKLGTTADTIETAGATGFGAWKGLTTTTNFDALAAATRQRMQQAMIDPYNTVDPIGYFTFNTDGERIMNRGSHWNSTVVAGPGNLNLSSARTNYSVDIGFFPAYIGDL